MRSLIQWTDLTWNPIRGCSPVSPGCKNCYAAAHATRFCGPGLPFEGFATRTKWGPRWTGRVELLDDDHLYAPLRWSGGRTVFVNSMSDLFHEDLSDEAIARVYGVMAATPWHTYQVLTKRPTRAATWYLNGFGGLANAMVHRLGRSGGELLPPRHCEAIYETFELCTGGQFRRCQDVEWPGWPLPNVHLGVSVENQTYAEARLPILQLLPAAIRFASAEPLLGPVDLDRHELGWGSQPWLDWLIVGGESGPHARPLDLAWIEQLVGQADQVGKPVFVKQLGRAWAGKGKGGDPAAWPENLRRRQMPLEQRRTS